MIFMAIIEIRKTARGENYEKEREMEIKRLLTELENGSEAVVEIGCKPTAYRTSFEHYRKQYNLDAHENKRFTFSKGENNKQLIILRIN